MLVYTVGITKSYDEYLLEDPAPRKVGLEPGYSGGSIWLTAEAAKSYLTTNNLGNYSVYSVEIASMHYLSSEFLAKNGWYDLLVTSPILGKVDI